MRKYWWFCFLNLKLTDKRNSSSRSVFSVWTLTVDPLCRVSCSSTAAGSTLNPDYTSETPENNVSKTIKEKSPLSGCFSSKKTQTAVRGSCRRKSLRDVGESLRNDSQEHGGGGGRDPTTRTTTELRSVGSHDGSSVLDMWRFLFFSLRRGTAAFYNTEHELEKKKAFCDEAETVCVCVCVCVCQGT